MVTAQIEKKWRRELRRANAHGLNNEARVSVHEAGHSLCHWLLPGAERFMRIVAKRHRGRLLRSQQRREVAQLLAEAGRTCQTLLRYRKCALQKIALELYARKTLKYRDMRRILKKGQASSARRRRRGVNSRSSSVESNELESSTTSRGVSCTKNCRRRSSPGPMPRAQLGPELTAYCPSWNRTCKNMCNNPQTKEPTLNLLLWATGVENL